MLGIQDGDSAASHRSAPKCLVFLGMRCHREMAFFLCREQQSLQCTHCRQGGASTPGWTQPSAPMCGWRTRALPRSPCWPQPPARRPLIAPGHPLNPSCRCATRPHSLPCARPRCLLSHHHISKPISCVCTNFETYSLYGLYGLTSVHSPRVWWPCVVHDVPCTYGHSSHLHV